MGPVLRTASSLLSAVIVFVLVTLLVAWTLEDEIYFSLFVGIPAGALCGAVTFASMTHYLRKRHASEPRAADLGRGCGP